MSFFNSSFNSLKNNHLFQFQDLWKMLPVNGFGNLEYREFLKKFSGEQQGLEKAAKSLPGSARATLERPTSLRRPKTAPCAFRRSAVHLLHMLILVHFYKFSNVFCIPPPMSTVISVRAASKTLHCEQKVHTTAEL